MLHSIVGEGSSVKRYQTRTHKSHNIKQSIYEEYEDNDLHGSIKLLTSMEKAYVNLFLSLLCFIEFWIANYVNI